MENLYNDSGITIKQLKDLIKDWPEENIDGGPTEVWMMTGNDLHSCSMCKGITRMDMGKEDNLEWAGILLNN